MKIAIFSDTTLDDVNGVSNSINVLIKELENTGHEVLLVTSNNKLQHIYDGKIIKLPGKQLSKLYGYNICAPYDHKILKALKLEKIDVIHVHTEFGVGIIGRKVAKKLKVPLVSTYHTMYVDYVHYINPTRIKTLDKAGSKAIKKISKKLHNKCNYVIVPSQKAKKALRSYGVKAPMATIPTGIDTNYFSPSNEDEKISKSLKVKYNLDNKLVFTYIGRIAREKSLTHSINRYVNFVDKNPGIKTTLLIIGGGPSLKYIESKITKLEQDYSIHLIGKLPHNEVRNYYYISDLFINSSRTETQGLTFFEALATGTPLIARTDEAIDKKEIAKFSYLYETNQQFNDFIIEFSKLSETERKEMSFKCSEYTKQFDKVEFGKAVIQIYETVLKGGVSKTKKYKRGVK